MHATREIQVPMPYIMKEAQALGMDSEQVSKLIQEEQKSAKEKADREERAAERELKRYYEGLKLPTFNDGQDDIDSYLQRFERFAKLHKWNKEDYHVYLGSLLRGHALKVYVSLPDDTVSNYEKLKEALLRAYSVDADMEQLLSNCNSDMRIFLKEREFVTAVEMAESADRFRSAHLYRGKRTNQTPIFKATQSVKEGVKLPTEPYPPDDPSLPVPDKADLPPSILPNHLDAKDPSSLIHPETSSPILTPFIDNQVCTASSDVKKTEARLPVVSMAVQTRASRKRSEEIKSLSYPVMEELDLSKDSFLKAQNACRTLQTIRDRVETGSVEKVKSRSVKYERINGLIYRVCLHSKDEHELNNMQLVIPAVYRDKVLQLAHDSLIAGHFSHRKTSLKVFENFFWPGAGADIKRYCKSCHICQKVSPKGRVKRVPMKTVPVIQEPFSRVLLTFCNGMVERLNGVLKSMLKKLCSVHPRDWDRYIPATLFAYREMPNDSLKFSPFELLYGRTVRGPLNILHELWSNNEINHEVKSTYQYVTDLRHVLKTAKLAAAKAEISSRNYKYYYDLKAKHRKLEVGDEVLVLFAN
nr:uncharacterized protein LOC113805404 [Penaeus vannamei]